jgi:uncharacterized membrane protein
MESLLTLGFTVNPIFSCIFLMIIWHYLHTKPLGKQTLLDCFSKDFIIILVVNVISAAFLMLIGINWSPIGSNWGQGQDSFAL